MENEAIPTNSTDMKTSNIIREYYKQLQTNTFDDFNETHKVLKRKQKPLCQMVTRRNRYTYNSFKNYSYNY